MTDIEELEAAIQICNARLKENTATMDIARARIDQLETALRHIEDTLGYASNEGKSPAIRESNAHIAWKIARAALQSPEQDK